jgi:hypothetical protein
LTDEASRQRLGQAASQVTTRHQQVIDQTLEALAPLFRDAGLLDPVLA